jgi:AAA family ATP:ADP antiporter
MKPTRSRLFDIHAAEAPALMLSFIYFMLLLSSYYMLRPLRDALAASVNSYALLSTAVFISMLILVPIFGWLVSRVARRILLPSIYAFFTLQLLLFVVAFHFMPQSRWVGGLFYVWITVFNMFVVAVFWSFMADLWHEEQARRLFGVIAAGGSAGGFAGPILSRALVQPLGIDGVALVAAALLAGTIICISILARRLDASDAKPRGEMQHGAWGGVTLLLRSPFLLGIAGLVAMYSIFAMFVYIETGRLALLQYPEVAARTRFFATLDLWSNATALVLQFAIIGNITRRVAPSVVLMGVGVLAALSFVPMMLMPTLAVLAGTNVLRRAMEYGLAKPARDMLYTVVDRETKYKVKNVIETTLYRGTDMTATGIHALLTGAGLTLAAISGVSAVMALGTSVIAFCVGRGYAARRLASRSADAIAVEI